MLDVSAIERLQPFVDQRLGLALPLGLRAARALDVGASAIVMAVEEQDPRPEIDRRVELAGEVVIEAGDQQLLDARVAPGGAWRLGRGRDDDSGSAMTLSAAQYSTYRVRQVHHGSDRYDGCPGSSHPRHLSDQPHSH